MNCRRHFIKTSLLFAPVIFYPKLIYSKPDQLKKVLLLGDSISIGYTPFVQDLLKHLAVVSRPMLANGRAENCQGTNNGVANIRRWIGDTKWDLIHFNFGLHDLKHVDSITGENSDNAEDPLQADLKQYKKNLKKIVEELKQTGADLIFATTTPYPDTVSNPLRDPGMSEKYNRVAIKIMNKNNIGINDLYTFAEPRLDEIQIPDNVHFTEDGYRQLAKKVADRITERIEYPQYR
ncbi:SGNH/GDSL hydrolase family protein [Maribellus mangrovi]|uniref:SGNH/GDSL hydrolase family protein n=1 Tax=Maribellus mangrovi TaxID=3133146 RepID=UPI0030EDE25C